MSNIKTLEPMKHVLSKEDRTKGGIKSGETRRIQKAIKEIFDNKTKINGSEDIQKIAEKIADKEKVSKVPFEKVYATNMVLSAMNGEKFAREKVDIAIDGNKRTEDEVIEIRKKELKIKEEDSKLKREQWEEEKKRNEIAINTEYDYKGISCLAIAPCYAPLQHHIEDKTYREFVLSGGRGSGKSSVIGLDVVDLIEKNEDYNALICRKVGKTIADSVYNQIVWAIGILGLSSQYKCTRSPAEITKIRTGQKIFFRGADDPLKIKSIKPVKGYIAVLWFEELDQFLGEEEIRSIKQSATRGGDDAYTFMSFNPPKTKMNWANKYVLTPRKDTYMLQTTYKDVPPKWLGKPFIEDAEYLKEVNYNAYEHEYLGVANGNGGNVFENIEIRELTDEEVKNFDRIYHGVDWGYYPDIYAFTSCHYDVARQTLYIYEEYTSNKESNERTADVLINQFHIGADLVTCDSAEPKSIADYRAFGINARETEKGAGSVEYSMKWLARLKIVIDPVRCPIATKEFSNYEYERDKEGNVISGYPDKDNHTIDSIRYALNPIWRRRGQ